MRSHLVWVLALASGCVLSWPDPATLGDASEGKDAELGSDRAMMNLDAATPDAGFAMDSETGVGVDTIPDAEIDAGTFIDTGMMEMDSGPMTIDAGEPTDSGVHPDAACDWPSCDPPIQIDLGDAHACALRGSGRVVCWGSNTYGQTGTATGSSASPNRPTSIPNLDSVMNISAGHQHTCAVRRGGTVVCFGRNNHGQLGIGTTTSSSGVVEVAGINDAVEVSVGEFHSCALTASDNVWCWGKGDLGALGDGNGITSSVPVLATGTTATNFDQISAGEHHTCAKINDGTVMCWGENDDNQVAVSAKVIELLPVQTASLTDVDQLSAGNTHTCAQKNNGEVLCWGANGGGRLGNGSTDPSAYPVAVSNLSNAQAISAGSRHTCAIRQTGEALCWGVNASGQLGDGTTQSSTVPVSVVGINDAVEVSTAYEFTCVRRQTGEVLCWGNNLFGQLGQGTAGMTPSLVPVAVPSP